MKKNEPPFSHRPFSKLAGMRVIPRPAPGQNSTVRPAPGSVPSAEGPAGDPDGETLFRRAMEGVRPLEKDIVEPAPSDVSSAVSRARRNRARQDREVMEALRALVRGAARFDITCTGEYVEGCVATLDPRIMKRLKQGNFAVQSHLDLHGTVREQARGLLCTFVENSHAMGYRCLLVIHGRGLKSESGPVLKDAVVRWLSTGSLSRLVLAFCSARPCDGGTGALYVLLKKRPVRSHWRRTV